MHICEDQTTTVSLVSWARTTRPVRLRSIFDSRTKRQPVTDATDNVFFGVSTVALILAPTAALIVVVFG